MQMHELFKMMLDQGASDLHLTAGAPPMVRVHGELWRAVSKAAVPEGASVRVLRVDGLTLHVEPLDAGTRH